MTLDYGTVYGVSGLAANVNIVGKYNMKVKSRSFDFSVINETLFVDGKEVAGAYLVGNKIVWNKVFHPTLSFCGEIEFSEDGERILSSSLGYGSAVTGGRVKLTQAQRDAVSFLYSFVIYYYHILM